MEPLRMKHFKFCVFRISLCKMNVSLKRIIVYANLYITEHPPFEDNYPGTRIFKVVLEYLHSHITIFKSTPLFSNFYFSSN